MSAGAQDDAELAHARFTNGEFKACLSSLQRLRLESTGGDHQKPADFRVLHNIALTTFALGGCTSANQLLREISTLDRYLSSGESSSATGVAVATHERLVLLLNQATLLFGQERFAHAGQLLEGMFSSIDKTDDGVALRLTTLLLEVYIHTYKGAAAGDSVTRAVVSSANRIFRHLQGKLAFNNRSSLIAIIEAARARYAAAKPAAADAAAAAAAAAAASDAAAKAADASRPIPINPGVLSSAEVVTSADPRRLASALCGAFHFTLHLFKARFALAANDTTTAAEELRASVASWREQVLEAGAALADGALAIDGLDACPMVLPRVQGDVEDGSPGGGGTDCLPLPQRLAMLVCRARLAVISGRTDDAVALLDEGYSVSESMAAERSPTGAAAAASSRAGGASPAGPLSSAAWPVPPLTLSRPVHLGNLAVVHARAGRLHLAAALLYRALAACGDAEAEAAGAISSSVAAADALKRASSGAAGASAADDATLAAISPGAPGNSRFGHGLRPRLPPPRRELLLNAGIVALLRRRPLEAFSHLRRAVMLFRQRPRLWVRLAEACIMYHEQCRASTAAGAVPGRIGDVWTVPPGSAATIQPAAHLEGASSMLGPDAVAAVETVRSGPAGGSAAAASSRGAAGDSIGRDRDMCWAGAGVVRAVFGEGSAQRMLLTSEPRTCPEPAMRDQLAMRSIAQAGHGAETKDPAATAAVQAATPGVQASPVEPDAPSLQYARACLENALCLLPASTAVAIMPPPIVGTVGEVAEGEASTPAAQAAARAASNSVKAASSGWRNTRAAALTKLAYVCLCLEDPVAALRFTNQVATETRPEPTGSRSPGLFHWWYMSRLYASEALCRLGRPKEAADILAVTEAPEGVGTHTSPRAEGRPAILVNLAIANTLSGRSAEAASAVREVLTVNPLAMEARAVSSFVTQLGFAADTRDLLARGIAPVTVTAAAAGGTRQHQHPQQAAARQR